MQKVLILVSMIILAAGLPVFTGGCAPEVLPEENTDAAADLGQNMCNAEDIIILPGLVIENKTVPGAINERISRRAFSADGLDLEQVGILLWSAGGIGVDGVSGATRTIPSAGATYPLDTYLVAGTVDGLEAGVYRYDHQGHALALVAGGDRREQLAGAALDQQFIAEAPVSICLVAHYERTTGRYGERGKRYVHMDAGYASQNIYLVAEELGLGTVAIGAFDDHKTADILETTGDPLMIMPVGLPR